MTKGHLVTGTGTSVGKTLLRCTLLHALATKEIIVTSILAEITHYWVKWERAGSI